MNWINRSTARIGSFAAVLAAIALPALADTGLTATYGGHAIRFTHISASAGATAIGVEDPGFQTLLRETGAVLTWRPGERYILITTSAPTVVSFALGDRRYDVGPISLQAGFAPFLQGSEAYLPLREVLRALDLALRQTGTTAVLQPQLAALDVHQEGVRTTVLVHGGAPLHARVAQESGSAITYAFDGVGTTLSGNRTVQSGGVASIAMANAGTLREPTALVTVQLLPGTVPEAPQNTDGRDVMLAFDAAGSPASQNAAVGPSPTPEPQPLAPGAGAAATITGVTAQPAADGVVVDIAISGNASYEWHRLRQPDNRFWIDISGAQLQGPPIESAGSDPLISLRARQVDPSTVRVALSLSGPKTLELSASASGIEIAIAREDLTDVARSGEGTFTGGAIANTPIVAAVTPAPQSSDWKFGPRSGYVPTNPRLIVIDPGHGGSDRGTIHGGVAEADLTLDMAKRLRAILIARGWEVKLTHDTDVDVYEPDDSARDELQARDDIANNAGARVFVSIHANAYINAGPYGTTFYISKAEDEPLARSVEMQMADDGTKDDGIVKSHMYVTLHARMPAVLIETAFLSNPSDYALLTSSEWRQKVAQEMADGIAHYAREYPVTGQPGQ